MTVRPAAGGGRLVDVAPERLTRWLDGFAARHGGVARTEPRSGGVRFVAADGALAEVSLPYGGNPTDQDELVREALTDRRIGLLLARRGAYAVGIAVGDTLTSSKVDRQYVQGRTAAGGWSQQRFARRRQNQARQAATAAADVAARLLLPEIRQLDAVVAGGDRQAIDAVLADRRLEPVRGKLGGWFLTVPEPRQTVLAEAAKLARMVRIRVVEPGRDVSTEHD